MEANAKTNEQAVRGFRAMQTFGKEQAAFEAEVLITTYAEFCAFVAGVAQSSSHGLIGFRGVRQGRDATEAAANSFDNLALGRLSENTPNKSTDIFNPLNGKDIAKLTKGEKGAIGEEIAKNMLRESGFTDIISIQNNSGNGLDIIARSQDGRIVFFEVKTTGVGKIGDLKNRQKDLANFVEDILSQAATKSGRYANIDEETFEQALFLWNNFDKRNVSGVVMGIDLEALLILVSPWRFN
jgi:Holliday junction resolvase-like predicted endonuclease